MGIQTFDLLERVFLSKEDSLVDGNRVINGDFNTGTTAGWEAVNSTLSVESGKLRVTNSTASAGAARQKLTVGPDQPFVFNLEFTAGSVSSIYVHIGTTEGGKELLDSGDFSSDYSKVLTSTVDTIYIKIHLYNWTAGEYIDIDNVGVFDLMEPDRSINDNPLRVIGELQKTPVAAGSELVAYSGFTENDYLEQPYNSDLDFGTGDFYVMCWVKPKSLNVTISAIKRSFNGTSGDWVLAVLASTGQVRFTYSGIVTVTSTATVSVGQYSLIGYTRRGGEGYVIVNGIGYRNDSGVETSLTKASAPFIAGYAASASLSLIRIGAGSLSAEQVKYMYDTEKHLFKEGSLCTLEGPSVKALSYSKETDLLDVGTATGLNVLQGLEVLEKSSSSSPASVVASEGLYVAREIDGEVDLAHPGYTLPEVQNTASNPQKVQTLYKSAGAGQTSIQVPFGNKPVLVYDSGILVDFTTETDGFYEYVTVPASTGDITILMEVN